MGRFNSFLWILSVFFILSCGTYSPKYVDEDNPKFAYDDDRELDKRFYLIGDAGAAYDEEHAEALNAFKSLIVDRETKNDYVIYLGDNIYPAGLPPKSHKKHEEAKGLLNAQLDVLKGFDGKKLFIPGNHDWYADGLKGLKRQEEYVEKVLDNNDAFQPENGCPIEKISVSENIELLVLDTQWYISDWDKHPTINDDCDYKSRKAFFLEIENELKKNNEKTIIIAMHHPAFTYGLHGGYFNFQKHIFAADNKIPLPGIASLVTLVRSQGGVSPQDRYNNRYNELMKRLITLVKDSDRVVFTSGHEHTLQYINNGGVKQIVSGAGSKKAPVALGKGAEFVYGGRGFVVLNVYKNGSSVAEYYSAKGGKPEMVFSTEVHQAPKEYDVSGLPDTFEPTITTSAYTKEQTDVSGGYRWFWGDHYRYVYGTDLKVPVVTLDTLLGGMTVVRKGGGHQTRSLRLNDPQGRNFALRAVNKSAVQFLQSVAFTDTYVQEDFKETLTEDVIKDFYTSSHPFGHFVMGDLSDAVGIYHTNPVLFYMPKHKALGKYNDEFGDELYIMEERPDDGFLDVDSFGKPDAIESTSDLLENLREDEEYRIDEEAYIRARLFDMLVGDWDRHQDQWRWARFDKDGLKTYQPIPRDRDQVFSNYDGALFSILNTIMPATKQFQVYDDELKDIRWINLAGIKLDRTLSQTSGWDVWEKQARYIQENLSDAQIDNAFTKLPKEVQDETSNDIKAKLKARRGTLVDIARRYFKHLNSLVIITATDKDDYIEVERTRDQTTVRISRIKDGKVQPPFKIRTVNHRETKELWLYGLDDDDRFVFKGKGNNPTMLRVVGGQNNDIYSVEGNGRKIKIYDHRSKPNTIEKAGTADFKFKDNYRYNIYRYDKYIDKVSTILPSVGFNPDDGLKVGLMYSSAKRGFKNDPFQVKHTLGGAYYFATQGFEVMYEGEFTTFFDTWNVLTGGRLTSENFTQNFFGFGNDTDNDDDEFGLDYNRVKTATRSVKLGVVKDGHYGSRIEVTGGVESIEVQETPGRFIEFTTFEADLFDNPKTFGNFDVIYSYAGFDNAVSPTRGMFFKLESGIKMNLEQTHRTFGFVNPSLEFYNALTRNRKLVLNTQIQGRFNIGDAFEFYQGATLGATNGLRGYREQRFTGERALAFKGDLRYHLAKFKTGLLPLKLGIYGGYDYGRVWIDDEDSDTWHDSFGGGFWVNAVDSISGNFGLFGSDDGLRFFFGFGLSL